MGLRGYTLSETRAPFPLCLDLGVGVGAVLQEAYDGWALCSVSQRDPWCEQPVGGRGVIWLSIDAAHFSCSLSDCATVPAEQTGPHPKPVALP